MVGAIAVHQARPDNLVRIGRFRYQTYVVELGKLAKFADHREKTLLEPADQSPTSVVFYTEESGEVTGTVRVTLGPFLAAELQPYANVTDAPQLKDLPAQQIVLVSRLMVKQGVRGMGEGFALVRKSFDFSCQNGVVLGLASCNPAIEPFFARCGFSACGPDYLHQDAGMQRPLAIIVEPQYLLERRSRFLELCMAYKSTSPWTAIFEGIFKGWNAVGRVAAEGEPLIGSRP